MLTGVSRPPFHISALSFLTGFPNWRFRRRCEIIERDGQIIFSLSIHIPASNLGKDPPHRADQIAGGSAVNGRGSHLRLYNVKNNGHFQSELLDSNQLPTTRPPNLAVGPSPETAPTLTSLPWSPEQQAIFSSVRNPDFRVLIVDAKAGSGKTATLLECLNYIPPHSRVLLLAFNSAIARHLNHRISADHKRRADISVKACTFHSLGFRAWRASTALSASSFYIQEDKTALIFRDVVLPRVGALAADHHHSFARQVAQLVSKAKLHGIPPRLQCAGGLNGAMSDTARQFTAPVLMGNNFASLTPDTDEAWLSLAGRYSILTPSAINEDAYAHYRVTLLRYCRETLAESVLTAGGGFNSHEHRNPPYGLARWTLDYDDMVYLPVVHNSAFERREWVMVDEAQDMSEARAAVVERCVGGAGLRLKSGVGLAAAGLVSDLSILPDPTPDPMDNSLGRLLVFGDRFQAIYGWTGATSEFLSGLMDRGRRENGARNPALPFGPATLSHDVAFTLLPHTKTVLQNGAEPPSTTVKVLPLSTCFRCSHSVIREAQRYVPTISPHPTSPTGIVADLSRLPDPHELASGDYTVMILSRFMREVLNLAFRLTAHWIPCAVQGRCTGLAARPLELCEDVVRRIAYRSGVSADTALHAPMSLFLEELGKWREEALFPPGSDPGGTSGSDRNPAHPPWKLGGDHRSSDSNEVAEWAVHDRVDTVLTLARYPPRQRHPDGFASCGDFVEEVQRVYGRSEIESGPLSKGGLGGSYYAGGDPSGASVTARILLATSHQSRGLERDRVYVLNEDAETRKMALGDPEQWARKRMPYLVSRRKSASEPRDDVPRDNHDKTKTRGKEAASGSSSVSVLQPWERDELRNLMYVASTRAKKELFYASWNDADSDGVVRDSSDGTFWLGADAPLMRQMRPWIRGPQAFKSVPQPWVYLVSRSVTPGLGMVEKRRRPYGNITYQQDADTSWLWAESDSRLAEVAVQEVDILIRDWFAIGQSTSPLSEYGQRQILRVARVL
ncbi:P-loop containing nucleoside triphosphate hydrolase protein [Gonapodya prolifera JEL478]|uniref:p-loop containing nucleoside triphosphate hydrolase protein n=1 Tax=Gonapodya prolifera (strain JEL478) TaxID=1344416 RepID=A0A139AUD6_GONPJ|nr:P-loop containing nucleoside triphosphate hydrolase protein [Gonapodya prolifera JEL478]|eukprot:KXS20350.1 P-loop containing nucleoside triphosphate hydrolase protein [Gonapodya prolifera JEL478]